MTQIVRPVLPTCLAHADFPRQGSPELSRTSRHSYTLANGDPARTTPPASPPAVASPRSVARRRSRSLARRACCPGSRARSPGQSPAWRRSLCWRAASVRHAWVSLRARSPPEMGNCFNFKTAAYSNCKCWRASSAASPRSLTGEARFGRPDLPSLPKGVNPPRAIAISVETRREGLIDRRRLLDIAQGRAPAEQACAILCYSSGDDTLSVRGTVVAQV
jgi:hypothetical protein